MASAATGEVLWRLGSGCWPVVPSRVQRCTLARGTVVVVDSPSNLTVREPALASIETMGPILAASEVSWTTSWTLSRLLPASARRASWLVRQASTAEMRLGFEDWSARPRAVKRVRRSSRRIWRTAAASGRPSRRVESKIASWARPVAGAASAGAAAGAA